MEIKKGLLLVLLAAGTDTFVAYARMSDETDVMNAPEKKNMKGHAKRRYGYEASRPVKIVEPEQESRRERREREKEERKVNKKESRADRDKFFFGIRKPVDDEDAEYMRKLYFDVAYGMIKYSLFKTTLVNAANITDTIYKTHTSAVPMIRGGFGAEFRNITCLFDKDETTTARVGIQVMYSKKHNGVHTFYLNGGLEEQPVNPNARYTNNQPLPEYVPLVGRQDISRGELMFVGSYDVIKELFAVEGGFGVVGGALKDFRIYQAANAPTEDDGSYKEVPGLLYYTGQRLVPHAANAGGFVGLTLAHRFKQMDKLRFELGYQAVFSAVKYRKEIYQDQPSAQAAQQFQNGLQTTQVFGGLELQYEPSFVVCANELTLGVIIEF